MTNEVKSKCIVCRTTLPIDAPKTVKSIDCSFCEAPNPNPENLADNKPAKYGDSRQGTQTIFLNESKLSRLMSAISLALGIGLIIFFAAGNRFPIHYLLISSVLVFLPVFAVYFVPAHWENVCKWASSETGDKYQVVYNRDGIEWANYLGSYIFQVWYFGRLYTNVFNPRSEEAYFATWVCALVSAIGSVYILELTTKSMARLLGLIISRPK